MGTFEKAGKTAGEVFEMTVVFAEEIAAKAVDVMDALEEMVMDLPHNVKKHIDQPGRAEGKHTGPPGRPGRPA
jgi:hypothetical protein